MAPPAHPAEPRLKITSLTLLLLASCANPQDGLQFQDPAIETIRPALPGQLVTEVDPRIWCIHQDNAGDHWFGSNGNGVYRYSGQQTTHYTEADGLVGTQVRDIESDSRGNVFISTVSGVTKFDGERFTALEIIEQTDAADGWALEPDDIWLVSDPTIRGPLRYDGNRLWHLKLPTNPEGDRLRQMYPSAGFSHEGVYTIHKDRRGHMWFGTSGVGLYRYDGESLAWMYEEHLTTTPQGGAFGIRSIYEDRAGDFWICNTRNRFQISPRVKFEKGRNLLRYQTKPGLPTAGQNTDQNFTYYMAITEDQAGNLWMAAGSDGIWKFDGKTITRYPIGNRAYALAIYHDREGNLWAGTVDQGLYTLKDASFTPFKP